MKPSEKAAWIAALESGEYQQARGQMCRIDAEGTKSYCCLGLYEEVVRHSVIKSYHDSDGDNRFDRNGALYRYLNRDLKWHPNAPNFFDRNPRLYGNSYSILTATNDNGATFQEIADYIRAWLIADTPEDTNA